MNTINLKTVNLRYFRSEMEKGQLTTICACYLGISCTLRKTQMLLFASEYDSFCRGVTAIVSQMRWSYGQGWHWQVNLVMGCNEPVQSRSWELHMSLWHPLRQHKVKRYGKYEDISVWSGRWLKVPLGRSYKLSSKNISWSQTTIIMYLRLYSIKVFTVCLLKFGFFFCH